MPSLKIKWQKYEVLKLTLKMAVFSAKSERVGTAAVDFSQIMCAKTRPHMGQSRIREQNEGISLSLNVLPSSLVMLVLGESILEELID